jgi:DNA-binding MarR family transcriptional regulator
MAPTAKQQSPAAEAWVLMGRLWMAHKRSVHAAAAEFELSPPQVQALREIQPGRPSAMSDLAGKLHCDNSNVTGIVDRLERRGLVERRSAEHDRRVKHLFLTPEGERVREAISARVDSAPEPLEALAPEDQRALRDVLRRALPERD